MATWYIPRRPACHRPTRSHELPDPPLPPRATYTSMLGHRTMYRILRPRSVSRSSFIMIKSRVVVLIYYLLGVGRPGPREVMHSKEDINVSFSNLCSAFDGCNESFDRIWHARIPIYWWWRWKKSHKHTDCNAGVLCVSQAGLDMLRIVQEDHCNATFGL